MSNPKPQKSIFGRTAGGLACDARVVFVENRWRVITEQLPNCELKLTEDGCMGVLLDGETIAKLKPSDTAYRTLWDACWEADKLNAESRYISCETS
jgi:hypothetical protein